MKQNRQAFDPSSPTQATPGSREKVRVLMLRAAAAAPLFVPGDAEVARPADLFRLRMQHDETERSEEEEAA